MSSPINCISVAQNHKFASGGNLYKSTTPSVLTPCIQIKKNKGKKLKEEQKRKDISPRMDRHAINVEYTEHETQMIEIQHRAIDHHHHGDLGEGQTTHGTPRRQTHNIRDKT